GHQTGPFILLMIVAFLTAFYMFRVVFLAFFGGPAKAGPHDSHHAPHDPPFTMLLPLWILAFLSLAVGIYSTFTGHVPIVAAAEHEAAPGWLTPAAIGVAL